MQLAKDINAIANNSTKIFALTQTGLKALFDEAIRIVIGGGIPSKKKEKKGGCSLF